MAYSAYAKHFCSLEAYSKFEGKPLKDFMNFMCFMVKLTNLE